jgi:GntR family transcriptional regulator, vanillate catabolism transcriptional regulator
VLEGTAARLAAERLEDPNQLEAIHGCVAQIDALVRPDRPAIEAFERYVELNERFHTLLLGLARSRALDAAYAGVLALPFASPSALLSSHADLPQSREILVVAQHQHRGIVDALERGQGSRAEEIAREHARISRTNLDLVLANRKLLEQLPGAPLLRAV